MEEEKKSLKSTNVKPRTQTQRAYLDAINRNKLICCLGPAGTGKTYIAAASAILGLINKKYDKIVITRPMVEAGEKTGFLPGDKLAKLKPFLKPIYEEFNYFVSPGEVQRWLAEEKIDVIPFAYMRGVNLKNCFVVADEMQNATKEQIKMLVSRYCTGSKMVLTGDYTQSDLHYSKQGGFLWLANQIVPRLEDAKLVEFDASDVVRDKLVKDFLNLVEEEENEKVEEGEA